MALGTKVFSLGKVAELAGIDKATLSLWVREGLITPSVDPGSGTGNRRIFSFRDVVAVAAAVQMRPWCQHLERLKPMIDYIREEPQLNLEHLPDGVLKIELDGAMVGHPGLPTRTSTAEELVKLQLRSKSWAVTAMFGVSLHKIVHDLREKIEGRPHGWTVTDEWGPYRRDAEGNWVLPGDAEEEALSGGI